MIILLNKFVLAKKHTWVWILCGPTIQIKEAHDAKEQVKDEMTQSVVNSGIKILARFMLCSWKGSRKHFYFDELVLIDDKKSDRVDQEHDPTCPNVWHNSMTRCRMEIREIL